MRKTCELEKDFCSMPFYYQPHIFFSYVAAIVLNMFFETPFVAIERKLLKKRRKKDQISDVKTQY
jgi:hypothetical protein